MTTRERALQAAKSGYSISECIYCPGMFFVTKPDNTRYTVDGETCNCPATVKCCKHVALVAICTAYVATLTRKAAAIAAQPVRTRRFFSARRLAALRALAPVMAGPKPTDSVYVPSPEAIALRERIAARIDRDFPTL